ncbi:hypothetical protein GALL_76000 [mine drainage metagenome]|uniref:Uncharacterized protein n=1 Tax=mine drainage metagenome TaxID=410659 RepID=A0A1J5T209_9ZZZZ
MALCSQVIYFVRLHFLDDVRQAGRIGHIAVMQEERLALFMHVMEQVIDASGIEQGAAALDTMHLITLVQQQFGEVGSVLSGDASNQCDFFGFAHFNPFKIFDYLP